MNHCIKNWPIKDSVTTGMTDSVIAKETVQQGSLLIKHRIKMQDLFQLHVSTMHEAVSCLSTCTNSLFLCTSPAVTEGQAISFSGRSWSPQRGGVTQECADVEHTRGRVCCRHGNRRWAIFPCLSLEWHGQHTHTHRWHKRHREIID